MRKSIFFSLLCLFSLSLFSQNIGDPIEIERVKSNYLYKQNGKILTPSELVDVSFSDKEAFETMKFAKSNHDIATVFNWTGGLLIGAEISSSIVLDNSINWYFIGAGAGFIMLAIPFINSYHKKAQESIYILNKQAMRSNAFELGFYPSYNGFTVVFNF